MNIDIAYGEYAVHETRRLLQKARAAGVATPERDEKIEGYEAWEGHPLDDGSRVLSEYGMQLLTSRIRADRKERWSWIGPALAGLAALVSAITALIAFLWKR